MPRVTQPANRRDGAVDKFDRLFGNLAATWDHFTDVPFLPSTGVRKLDQPFDYSDSVQVLRAGVRTHPRAELLLLHFADLRGSQHAGLLPTAL